MGVRDKCTGRADAREATPASESVVMAVKVETPPASAMNVKVGSGEVESTGPAGASTVTCPWERATSVRVIARKLSTDGMTGITSVWRSECGDADDAPTMCNAKEAGPVTVFPLSAVLCLESIGRSLAASAMPGHC